MLRISHGISYGYFTGYLTDISRISHGIYYGISYGISSSYGLFSLRKLYVYTYVTGFLYDRGAAQSPSPLLTAPPSSLMVLSVRPQISSLLLGLPPQTVAASLASSSSPRLSRLRCEPLLPYHTKNRYIRIYVK